MNSSNFLVNNYTTRKVYNSPQHGHGLINALVSPTSKKIKINMIRGSLSPSSPLKFPNLKLNSLSHLGEIQNQDKDKDDKIKNIKNDIQVNQFSVTYNNNFNNFNSSNFKNKNEEIDKITFEGLIKKNTGLAKASNVMKIIKKVKSQKNGFSRQMIDVNEIEVNREQADKSKESKDLSKMGAKMKSIGSEEFLNSGGTLASLNLLKNKEIKLESESIIKSISSKSRQGTNYDGVKKINQDSFIAKRNIMGYENFSILAVYDGHGTHGHFISNTVKNFIVTYFSKSETYSQKIKNGGISIKYENNLKNMMTEDEIYQRIVKNDYEILKSCYMQAHHHLRRTKYEVNFSGTTAVTVLIIGKKVICVNSGDSRAIMINEKKKDEKSYPEIIELSRDHKPDIPEESYRITKMGGEVERLREDSRYVGPYRVWVKNETFPGLAMSRSLGDYVATSVGVTFEPGKIS